MSEQFTPGPWVVENFQRHLGVKVKRKTKLICEVAPFFDAPYPYWKEGVKEGRANARLIAASPALYEACKAVSAFQQDACKSEQPPGNWLDVLVKVIDALALVEGGKP